MLTHLLENYNNNNITDNAEENLVKETPKSEQSNEGSLVDADVVKDIQAHITSLSQRDEKKKVGMTHP